MTLLTQAHRLSDSTCHRHHTKPITGFCAQCLSERLAGIESATSHGIQAETTLSAADLRRSKSYSGEGFAGLPEPRRNSCDVRARNTLWDLFHKENGRGGPSRKLANLGFELKEENEDEEDIRVSETISSADANVIDHRVEKFEEFDEGVEMKTMKEHIDLEWQSKKSTDRDLKDMAGSFWQAASVFSKNLMTWRGKQKLKKASAGMPSPKRFREPQSDVGDYGLGSRSCDTNPRMSLDAGRKSCDDEPRASWDGCLIGKAYPRLAPLVSVVEDVKVHASVGAIEEMKSANAEHKSHGGSVQTQDYYSLRRWRTFDRRAPGLEVEEVKSLSDAKVTPETIGLFHGEKLLITERELMESNWNQPSGSHSSESTHSGAYDIAPVAGQKGFMKLQWHKVWDIWGSIQKQRQTENKREGEEKYLGRDVIEGRGAVREKRMRSYSVTSRNSYNMVGLVHKY